MPFAQVNYHQSLGSGPSVSTIADVGCFLTSFCNLLERLGEGVDPPTLNNYFIAHGSFLADGPNRDNLGWGSVSAYDGNIVVTGIGGAGWPNSNEAIVKFIYKGPKTGAQIPHFCLVVDHVNGIILDSYDGHVKHSPYGTPVAWATYERHKPQVVPPPPPVEASAFTVDNVPHKKMQFKKNTHLWDLNQRSWPALVNNPANDVQVGATFDTSRIARHILGGSYYMPDGDNTHGYNVIDCTDYVATPSNPLPAGPIKPGGNPDIRYTVIKTIPGYTTATNAGNHTAQVTEVKPGEYYVYNTHPNNASLINVTSILGQPGSWVNKADNVETPAPAPTPPPAPVPAPVPTPPVVTPVDPNAPVPWRDTFKPFEKPVHYIATRDIKVEDLSGQQPDMPLQRYVPGAGNTQGMVSVFGTVTKEGVDYYRLKTNNDPEYSYWYAIPKIDQNTRTPNLLAVPASGNPIGTATVARDTIHLAKSRIETDVTDFLEMIPKWFKHKK